MASGPPALPPPARPPRRRAGRDPARGSADGPGLPLRPLGGRRRSPVGGTGATSRRIRVAPWRGSGRTPPGCSRRPPCAQGRRPRGGARCPSLLLPARPRRASPGGRARRTASRASARCARPERPAGVGAPRPAGRRRRRRSRSTHVHRPFRDIAGDLAAPDEPDSQVSRPSSAASGRRGRSWSVRATAVAAGGASELGIRSGRSEPSETVEVGVEVEHGASDQSSTPAH